MSTLRLMLHVLLAGVYVFLTSLTLLVQSMSAARTVGGGVLLLLLGAWAGASATLRSLPSLMAAGAGVSLLFLLAVSGGAFSFSVNFWVLTVMVPLAAGLWAVVAWRRFSESPGVSRSLRPGRSSARP